MISPTMAPDPRHLRARWTIAAAGWLLWAILMPMPLFAGSVTRMWDMYPQALRALAKLDMSLRTVERTISAAALIGGVVASAVFLASPLLVACNHSLSRRTRRWRWIGLGLLAMAQLTVMLAIRRGGPVPWAGHLVVVSYLLVGVAIIPWPRERMITQSGFDVLIPGEQPPPAAPAAEEK